MFIRILIGILLLLHGLIHGVLALIPNPDAAEPAVATFFSGWANSFIQEALPAGTVQLIAILLASIAGLGFLGAGLAMFGVLPHGWWRVLAIAASAVSLLLCLAYWNTYLVVGPVVAVGIIVALVFFRWPTEAALGF